MPRAGCVMSKDKRSTARLDASVRVSHALATRRDVELQRLLSNNGWRALAK